MKQYYGYIRVSTKRQGEGTSPEEQRSAIQKFAIRHSLSISEWFEEKKTAAKRGRAAFDRMLTQVERGKATGIIVHKIDRSARNLSDWARLGELIDSGVEVHFTHDSLDLSTRGGRLAADIQAIVAADFIRNLRDEVRKGNYGRLRQGFFPRAAPVGYLNHGKAQPKTIDPVKGPLVRSAFELYATGRYSLHTLRAEMASRGLKTAGGNALSLGNFARLLKNPFYIGIMRVPATGEEFVGNHDPLVATRVFDRVQDILAGRLYPRIEIHEFRFRRLIKCKGCGRSLTGERQKGHVYYRCHAHECRGTSVSERKLDAFIHEQLSLLSLTKRVDGRTVDVVDIGDVRAALRKRADRENGDGAAYKASIARDLANVESRLARLTDALLDGSLDRDEYMARKAELARRRAALRERGEQPHSTHWRNVSDWFELGITAQQGYDLMNEHEQRDLLSMLGSNLLIHQKSIDFPMFPTFDAMRKLATATTCEPNQRAVRTFFINLNDNQRRVH